MGQSGEPPESRPSMSTATLFKTRKASKPNWNAVGNYGACSPTQLESPHIGSTLTYLSRSSLPLPKWWGSEQLVIFVYEQNTDTNTVFQAGPATQSCVFLLSRRRWTENKQTIQAFSHQRFNPLVLRGKIITTLIILEGLRREGWMGNKAKLTP